MLLQYWQSRVLIVVLSEGDSPGLIIVSHILEIWCKMNAGQPHHHSSLRHIHVLTARCHAGCSESRVLACVPARRFYRRLAMHWNTASPQRVNISAAWYNISPEVLQPFDPTHQHFHVSVCVCLPSPFNDSRVRIWRYLLGLDWLMVGVRSGWAGWTLLKAVCGNEKQADRSREEKEGEGGQKRASGLRRAPSTSPAVSLWAKLKEISPQHDIKNKRDICREYLQALSQLRLPRFILENENMNERMCLMTESSGHRQRNVSWDAWWSGLVVTPGFRIAGAYGCGHEGQTYSSLRLLDSCSNKDIYPPPLSALDPHSLSVPPCLPVCNSVCVCVCVCESVCVCVCCWWGWPGPTGEDSCLLIADPTSGLRRPGTRVWGTMTRLENIK